MARHKQDAQFRRLFQLFLRVHQQQHQLTRTLDRICQILEAMEYDSEDAAALAKTLRNTFATPEDEDEPGKPN